jgi:hypothetical protein
MFVNAATVMAEFTRDVLLKINKEKGNKNIVAEENAPKTFIRQLVKISQSGESFEDDAVLAEAITAVLAVLSNLYQIFFKYINIHFKNRETKRQRMPCPIPFSCLPCFRTFKKKLLRN